jgi:hypothetical protein
MEGARWMKPHRQTLIDVERNNDKHKTKLQQNKMDSDDANDGVVERFASMSHVVMACRKEKGNLFSTSCFFLLFSSSSSIVITKATHYMIASSKTHMSA